MRSAPWFVWGALGFLAGCGAERGRGSLSLPLAASSAPGLDAAVGSDPTPVRSGQSTSPSSAELEAATLRTLETACKARDASRLVSAYASDARIVFPGFPEAAVNANGRAAIEERARSFWSAFPDARYAWSREWRTPGVAIVESSWTGTNAGALFGAKATYRPAGGVSLTLTWFAPGGLIREQHVYSDADSVAIQLGLAHGLGHEKSRPFEGLPTSREEHSANGTVVEQANVELVKAGFSRAGLRDSKGFLSWIAEDAEYVDFTRPGSRKDRGGVERWFRAVTTTPSDSLETALNVWGIEDYVIREHAAEPHRTSGVEILQIQGGKLVRGWGYAR